MSAWRFIALALCALALPAAAESYKVGVIHIERILRDSPPARAALARIEADFRARDVAIAAREQSAQEAAAQLERVRATLPEADRVAQEREVESRVREAQRQREQFAEALRTRQLEELDKLKERLDVVLTRLAHEQNYDLILQSALWVGKSVDITDEVIKALSAN